MSGNLSVNRNVLGAWIRLCQILENNQNVSTKFEVEHINELIGKIKNVMCQKNVDFQNHLKTVLGEYGIDFSVVKNFRGAPVQGYIFRRSDGVYQMVLTIRGAFADNFWFSLFHELGHIVNGDIGKSIKFIELNITFKRLSLSSQSLKLQRFIVWPMIFARNLRYNRRNI